MILTGIMKVSVNNMPLSAAQLERKRQKLCEQERQNEQCRIAMDTIESHIDNNVFTHWKPLYHCQAAYAVFAEREDRTHWYALRSYNTIVCIACYDTDRKRLIVYDLLRWVYGYTATSAQHIAKFRRLLLTIFRDCKTVTNYVMRPID